MRIVSKGRAVAVHIDPTVSRCRLKRGVSRLLLLACAALVPLAARAQQGAAKFQQDPVDKYGTHFLTAIILVGVVLVLYSLLRYRGNVVGPVSWGLLILGVAIIPGLTSGLGTVLVFERAEHVDFCSSCHLTMKTYVDDMENPKSDSFAAIHFKNRYIADDQCYICHTSYGLFGTVKAKEAGIIDVYKYYTHTFHLPIKLREAYPNTDCLKCHAGSVKWQESHADYKDAVFSGDMSCMQCHGLEHKAHNVPG
jgi:hypothetical protein